jgi:hypothetical protein
VRQRYRRQAVEPEPQRPADPKRAREAARFDRDLVVGARPQRRCAGRKHGGATGAAPKMGVRTLREVIAIAKALERTVEDLCS